MALRPSITLLRVVSSLTSYPALLLVDVDDLDLAALLGAGLQHPEGTPLLVLVEARVTPPSSAYSPILFGGLAQTGLPLT